MKSILYLSILYSTCKIMAAGEITQFNLLDLEFIPADTYTDDSMDSFPSHNMTGQSLIAIPAANLPISDQNIPIPFIISTIFKFYEFTSSCVFTIVDRTNTVTIGLCLAPIRVGAVRVTLHLGTLPNMKASFTANVDLNNTWTKLLVYVGGERIRAFFNCSEYPGLDLTENLSEGVIIDSSSKVKIAFNLVDSQSIKGAIQELNIYPNADNSIIKELCDNGSSIIENIIEDYYDEDLKETGLESEESIHSMNKGDKGEPGIKGDTGPPGTDGGDGLRGVKGEKGQKGDNGQKGEAGESITGEQGPRGHTGPQGPIGLVGEKGNEGTCQCSSDVVSSLLLSMPKMRGPQGDTGPRGDNGAPGPRGLTGNIGPQGSRGPEGEKGERGERGDDGTPGHDGNTGPKGEPGRDGEPGPAGPRGLMGPPGESIPVTVEKSPVIPGPQGDQGPPGPQGPPGLRGDKGEPGDKGTDGIRGERGEMGHVGPEGPRGEKGDRGEAGKDGIPGAPGNHGRPADKAEKGNKGDKGERGLPAKLTSLLTDELDPQDKAAIVKKLRGPKGESGKLGQKGDMGQHGPIGPPGTPGRDGKDGVPGSQGDPGAKGDLGAQGVKGNKGNQGPAGPSGKGPKGDRGNTGKKGPPGLKGSKGDTGKPGPSGAKGEKGPTGTVGSQGLPGINGTKGEKGECRNSSIIDLNKFKGEKGARGEAGVDGNPGVPGPQGPPGICPDICKQRNYQEVSTENPTLNKENTVINDDEGIVMKTLMYTSIESLLERTSKVPMGTLVFVIKEEILLIRVKSGWKNVMMSSLYEKHVPTYTTHTEQPATQRPPRTIQPTRPSTISPPVNRVSTYHQTRNQYSRPPAVAPHHLRTYIRIAALNDPYDGANNRVAAHECYEQARQHGGNGATFVPFLATSVQDLRTIIKDVDRKLPVVNLKREPLFDSWESMFNGSEALLGRFDIFSFGGHNVMIDNRWPNKIVWHGGDSHGFSSSKQAYCNNWTVNECCAYTGTGSQLPKLLRQETYTCDFKFIVLCVEQTIDKRRHLRHEQYRRRYYNNRINGI